MAFGVDGSTASRSYTAASEVALAGDGATSRLVHSHLRSPQVGSTIRFLNRRGPTAPNQVLHLLPRQFTTSQEGRSHRLDGDPIQIEVHAHSGGESIETGVNIVLGSSGMAGSVKCQDHFAVARWLQPRLPQESA